MAGSPRARLVLDDRKNPRTLRPGGRGVCDPAHNPGFSGQGQVWLGDRGLLTPGSTHPYIESYKKGNYGEMVGRGAFEIGLLLLGAGEVGAAAEGAEAAGGRRRLPGRLRPRTPWARAERLPPASARWRAPRPATSGPEARPGRRRRPQRRPRLRPWSPRGRRGTGLGPRSGSRRPRPLRRGPPALRGPTSTT